MTARWRESPCPPPVPPGAPPPPQVDQLYDSLDLDGSGSLDLAEMTAALKAMQVRRPWALPLSLLPLSLLPLSLLPLSLLPLSLTSP